MDHASNRSGKDGVNEDDLGGRTVHASCRMIVEHREGVNGMTKKHKGEQIVRVSVRVSLFQFCHK